jgi:hypothetical protein
MKMIGDNHTIVEDGNGNLVLSLSIPKDDAKDFADVYRKIESFAAENAASHEMTEAARADRSGWQMAS